MMPAMTKAERQLVYDWVRKAERFNPTAEIRTAARANMRAPEGGLTMVEAEQVAARQASEHVKGLFYDALQRKQVFHQLRMAWPFAQAFTNTLWSWGKLMSTRPYMIEKFGRLGIGLSEEGSGVIYDDFDAIDPLSDRQSRDPTQGFIFTDPQSGEQMFAFPLVGSVLGSIFGIPGGFGPEAFQFKAPLEGLNLAFQGEVDYLPSLGPIITAPLSLLSSDEDYGAMPEWLRRYAFPYGEPRFAGGLLEAVGLPTWGRRLVGAIFNEEFRSYSYKGLLAYFASTKEYPGLKDNAQAQQDLIDDVKRASLWMTLIRAIGAAVLPAAPTQEIYAADIDGRLIGSVYLADHFRHLQEDLGGDWEAATKVFIDTYGEQALAAIVPASEGDIAISGPGWDFFRRNGDEAKAYMDIIGAFFPGDFSYEAYRFQVDSRSRESLSVEERTEKMLSFMYQAERTQIDAQAAKNEWDTEMVDQAVTELNIRYGGMVPTFSGESTESRLDKVRNAIDDFPELAQTRAGQGTELLFEAYDRWEAEAQRLYGQGLRAQKTDQQRTQFLNEVDQIAAEYGGYNAAEGSVDTIARMFARLVEPRS
jgi:hypothetical protein